MTILTQRIRHQLEHQRGPRYLRISTAICQTIDEGALQAGDRLPTHRALAEEVGVSVQTVSFAYAHAEQEGYLHARVGSGTYVSHHPSEQEAAFLQDRPLEDDQLIDLSIAGAISDSSQQQALRQTLLEMADSSDALQLVNAIKPFAGLDSHREVARQWLAQRQINVSAEQICICNGVTHGLLIAISSLVKPGATVACEALVDHGLISLARTLNFRLEGIAMDPQGMLPEALEQCCEQKQIAAICVTPNLHNPTTATMSVERRKAIAEIARRYNVPLVEDDVFGPLLSDAPAPISSYLPAQSYYISSFTKAAASGLRVGYLVPPEQEVHQVVGRLRASSWMASPITVELVSRWLQSGQMEQLIAQQQTLLKKRQALAARILKQASFQANPEGPLIWLQLPEHWRASDFIQQARQRNVVLTAAEPFVVGHQAAPHAVRISLASIESERLLARGLKTLAQLLQTVPDPSFGGDAVY